MLAAPAELIEDHLELLERASLVPEAIDAELERIRPAMETGRYIPDLDHCIPSDVSYENYCYYARQLTRLTGKD